MSKEIVKKQEQEIQTVQNNTPVAMIQMAIESGADLDKLEKLLTLQERWDANEARKKYNSDMVLVHKDIPMIGKSLSNPQTHSKYASLDAIICETKEIYTNHGFSISFYEGVSTQEAHIRICADVIHQLGHKETYYYDVPLDGKGLKGNANMTAIHAKASSTSYGRRYLMCMIWNIPTGDDNDGNNGVPAKNKTTTAPTQTMEPPKQTTSTSQKCIDLARVKFSSPETYKAWRVENGLIETIKDAKESDLATLYFKLKG